MMCSKYVQHDCLVGSKTNSETQLDLLVLAALPQDSFARSQTTSRAPESSFVLRVQSMSVPLRGFWMDSRKPSDRTVAGHLLASRTRHEPGAFKVQTWPSPTQGYVFMGLAAAPSMPTCFSILSFATHNSTSELQHNLSTSRHRLHHPPTSSSADSTLEFFLPPARGSDSKVSPRCARPQHLNELRKLQHDVSPSREPQHRISPSREHRRSALHAYLKADLEFGLFFFRCAGQSFNLFFRTHNLVRSHELRHDVSTSRHRLHQPPEAFSRRLKLVYFFLPLRGAKIQIFSALRAPLRPNSTQQSSTRHIAVPPPPFSGHPDAAWNADFFLPAARGRDDKFKLFNISDSKVQAAIAFGANFKRVHFFKTQYRFNAP
ncbi:hypothetical protein C8R47DRAFT_1229740 [Mycena vitilis]|nr:hypothetical protein C8R47DRAFT_1229740 [Mycena vitilis]